MGLINRLVKLRVKLIVFIIEEIYKGGKQVLRIFFIKVLLNPLLLKAREQDHCCLVGRRVLESNNVFLNLKDCY